MKNVIDFPFVTAAMNIATKKVDIICRFCTNSTDSDSCLTDSVTLTIFTGAIMTLMWTVPRPSNCGKIDGHVRFGVIMM
jgi:hypothetical protein